MNIPDEFWSDGCTFPGLLKPLGKVLGASRYEEACREHDFLRRHAVIPWIKADWLLAKRIWQHGLIGKLRAPLYFAFVVLTHPFYTHTYPLPEKWQVYSEHYQ